MATETTSPKVVASPGVKWLIRLAVLLPVILIAYYFLRPQKPVVEIDWIKGEWVGRVNNDWHVAGNVKRRGGGAGNVTVHVIIEQPGVDGTPWKRDIPVFMPSGRDSPFDVTVSGPRRWALGSNPTQHQSWISVDE